MDDSAILSAWINYVTAASSTRASVKSRAIALRALLRRSGKHYLTITRHELIADLARDGITAATRQNYKSLYHSFFTWLQDEDYRPDNPAKRLPKVRVPKQEANPVTTEDLQYLLHSGIYRRTRMWVLLYAYQGFRAAEIAAVSGEAIDWHNRRILSKEGKGGKEVWRPIHPLVWEALAGWPREGWLFPSPVKPGQHTTANNVSRILSEAMRRAGIQHRPHQLRAWYATEMIDGGASTVVVAAAMRHSGVQTVEKYVRVSDRAIVAAHALLPIVEVPTRSGRAAA